MQLLLREQLCFQSIGRSVLAVQRRPSGLGCRKSHISFRRGCCQVRLDTGVSGTFCFQLHKDSLDVRCSEELFGFSLLDDIFCNLGCCDCALLRFRCALFRGRSLQKVLLHCGLVHRYLSLPLRLACCGSRCELCCFRTERSERISTRQQQIVCAGIQAPLFVLRDNSGCRAFTILRSPRVRLGVRRRPCHCSLGLRVHSRRNLRRRVPRRPRLLCTGLGRARTEPCELFLSGQRSSLRHLGSRLGLQLFVLGELQGLPVALHHGMLSLEPGLALCSDAVPQAIAVHFHPTPERLAQPPFGSGLRTRHDHVLQPAAAHGGGSGDRAAALIPRALQLAPQRLIVLRPLAEQPLKLGDLRRERLQLAQPVAQGRAVLLGALLRRLRLQHAARRSPGAVDPRATARRAAERAAERRRARGRRPQAQPTGRAGAARGRGERACVLELDRYGGRARRSEPLEPGKSRLGRVRRAPLHRRRRHRKQRAGLCAGGGGDDGALTTLEPQSVGTTLAARAKLDKIERMPLFSQDVDLSTPFRRLLRASASTRAAAAPPPSLSARVAM